MGYDGLSHAGTDAAPTRSAFQSFHGDQAGPSGCREEFAAHKWRVRRDQAGVAEAVYRLSGPLCNWQRPTLPARLRAAALAARGDAVQPVSSGRVAENRD